MSMPWMIDMTGVRSGRLVVTRRAENDEKGRARWDCVCDCGTAISVVGKLLRNGSTQSCGCLRRDAVKHGLNLRHGCARNKQRTPEYRTWAGVLARCSNPNSTIYEYYGGRGITVCERWLDFDLFLLDMGTKPTDRHTIERNDVNGNYEPSNCRWATVAEQVRNRRNTVMLTAAGRTQPLITWAEELGIPYQALSQRMRKGWSPERAISTPLRVSRRVHVV